MIGSSVPVHSKGKQVGSLIVAYEANYTKISNWETRKKIGFILETQNKKIQTNDYNLLNNYVSTKSISISHLFEPDLNYLLESQNLYFINDNVKKKPIAQFKVVYEIEDLKDSLIVTIIKALIILIPVVVFSVILFIFYNSQTQSFVKKLNISNSLFSRALKTTQLISSSKDESTLIQNMILSLCKTLDFLPGNRNAGAEYIYLDIVNNKYEKFILEFFSINEKSDQVVVDLTPLSKKEFVPTFQNDIVPTVIQKNNVWILIVPLISEQDDYFGKFWINGFSRGKLTDFEIDYIKTLSTSASLVLNNFREQKRNIANETEKILESVYMIAEISDSINSPLLVIKNINEKILKAANESELNQDPSLFFTTWRSLQRMYIDSLEKLESAMKSVSLQRDKYKNIETTEALKSTSQKNKNL